MHTSHCLGEFNDIDLVVQTAAGLFGIGREMIIHGWADSSYLKETGSVTLRAKSVPNESTYTGPGDKTIDLPAEGFFTSRGEVVEMNILIRKQGPKAIRNCLICCLDLHMNLPDKMLQHILKQAVGVMLSFMDDTANKITNKPKKSPHVTAINKNKWYREWLVPKIREYFPEEELPPFVLEWDKENVAST